MTWELMCWIISLSAPLCCTINTIINPCMTSSATESIHRELHKHNVTKMEKIHTLTKGLHCTLWDIGLLAIYKSSHHKTLYVYPLSHEDR